MKSIINKTLFALLIATNVAPAMAMDDLGLTACEIETVIEETRHKKAAFAAREKELDLIFEQRKLKYQQNAKKAMEKMRKDQEFNKTLLGKIINFEHETNLIKTITRSIIVPFAAKYALGQAIEFTTDIINPEEITFD